MIFSVSELLTNRLNKGECECLVCCELIRTKDQIWHCLSCFHVFHLWCIKKWARSPAAAVEGKNVYRLTENFLSYVFLKICYIKSFMYVDLFF